MRNKSAKDIAFERERLKLQNQKKAVETQVQARDKTIKSLTDKIAELEHTICQQNRQIEKLLKYTNLTKEDLETVMKNEKAVAEMAELLGIFPRTSY